MGLDMYLKAKKYFSNYELVKQDEKKKFSAIIGAVGIEPCQDFSIVSVSVTIGYWRKANMIHGWFVKNVQAGEDNCEPHYVEREKLQELRAACMKVLGKNDDLTQKDDDAEMTEDQKRIANEVLPITAGFFFGGKQYGGWYMNDLRDTVKIIDKALAIENGCDFEYRASW